MAAANAKFAKETSRGGCRGKGEFSWEGVKGDDHYLGHSIMERPTWWDKGTMEESADKGKLAEEMAAVKEREEDLMRAALGLPPKKRKVEKKVEEMVEEKTDVKEEVAEEMKEEREERKERKRKDKEGKEHRHKHRHGEKHKHKHRHHKH